MKSFAKGLIVRILTWEARLVLRKYKPKIVAITGSVGKTSAKDAMYTVLAEIAYVRKSEKSFNSELGVPLTILGLPNAWFSMYGWTRNLIEGLALWLLRWPYPEWLVLEVGIDRPGDMERLTEWLKPDVVVLTRLPDVPVHVEFFDSPQAVTEEKKHLVYALRAGGTLILNGDDREIQTINAPRGGIRITYGFDDGVDVKASRFDFAYEKDKVAGIKFDVRHGGERARIELPGTIGRAQAYPLLAAFSLGIAGGRGLMELAETAKGYEPPRGRMRTLGGIKKTTLIDDSYNSSPIAVESALETLAALETKGRHIAVLGDMTELGMYTVEAHKGVGEHVARAADLFFAVGVRMHYAAEEAVKAGMAPEKVRTFDDAQRVGKELEHELQEGDVVLVKGSQIMRMERVVEEVMAHPEQKGDLLVRQDPHWLSRA